MKRERNVECGEQLVVTGEVPGVDTPNLQSSLIGQNSELLVLAISTIAFAAA